MNRSQIQERVELARFAPTHSGQRCQTCQSAHVEFRNGLLRLVSCPWGFM